MLLRTITTIACCAAGAAATLPAATDAAPRSGHADTFKGRTAQNRAIVLQVGHGRLDLRHFSIELRCRDGSVLIDQESGFEPAPLRTDGAFHENQVGSTDEVLFRGRAHRRGVRGRIRVKDRWGHVRCDSRWVKFSAKRPS